MFKPDGVMPRQPHVIITTRNQADERHAARTYLREPGVFIKHVPLEASAQPTHEGTWQKNALQFAVIVDAAQLWGARKNQSSAARLFRKYTMPILAQ
eukprot:1552975-Pyramimonas_sp.AAC.1